MATGYTAGIVDGKTKDFNEFAKTCIRAFGAAIHLRDEPISTPWTPRTTSDYHEKAIASTEKEIEELADTSDEILETLYLVDRNKSLKYYQESIEERKEVGARLKKFLADAQTWTPPTEEHENFKNFMIEQLEQTIRYDGDVDYYEKELKSIQADIDNPKAAKDIRKDRLESLEKNLEYHKKENEKEIENCKDNNEWAEALFNCLD